jgi:hypothetical protein
MVETADDTTKNGGCTTSDTAGAETAAIEGVGADCFASSPAAQH